MGTKVWWQHNVSVRQQQGISWSEVPNDEKRSYTLKIRKADKAKVLEPYVEHVMKTSTGLKHRSRDRLLYTNIKNNGYVSLLATPSSLLGAPVDAVAVLSQFCNICKELNKQTYVMV